MDVHELQEKFERMGARLKTGSLVRSPWDRQAREFAIDIREDARGEFFQLETDPAIEFRMDALDVRPKDRHLLLMVTEVRDGVRPGGDSKQKFLCGHDERSWFVAAVPTGSASNVITAMEALKPPSVRASLARHKVKADHRNRRKNRAFIRQGEWFFVPSPDLRVDPRMVLRNEPLQRSGGKPHRAEYAFRTGGETVYVNRQYSSGLTAEQFKQLVGDSSLRSGFRTMQRNASVFVKGRVSHPDHKTIVLCCWHRVEMNTENQAPAMRFVAFLD